MSTTGHFLQPGLTLLLECLVFAIVLAVLSRTALPRLRAAVDEHRDRLNSARDEVRQAQTARDNALDEARDATASAHRDARTILDQATRRHDELIADGRRAGREEYEWMRARQRREHARNHQQPTDPEPVASNDERN